MFSVKICQKYSIFLFHSEQKESMQLLIKHFHILKICSKWRTWALNYGHTTFFPSKKLAQNGNSLKRNEYMVRIILIKTEYGILFCGYGETNNHKIIIWLVQTWIWRTKLGNTCFWCKKKIKTKHWSRVWNIRSQVKPKSWVSECLSWWRSKTRNKCSLHSIILLVDYIYF